jgi:hypothetical protein
VVGFFELFSEQLALTSVQKLQDFCASQRPLEAPGLVPLSELHLSGERGLYGEALDL